MYKVRSTEYAYAENPDGTVADKEKKERKKIHELPLVEPYEKRRGLSHLPKVPDCEFGRSRPKRYPYWAFCRCINSIFSGRAPIPLRLEHLLDAKATLARSQRLSTICERKELRGLKITVPIRILVSLGDVSELSRCYMLVRSTP